MHQNDVCFSIMPASLKLFVSLNRKNTLPLCRNTRKLEMKIIPTLLIASVVALSVVACGNKKQNNDIIAKKPAVKAPASPVKMQDYNHRESVDWLGQQYGIAISRRADTSLPLVTDDGGGKYYDNRIEVRVTRPDGSVFFNRVFTKTDFAAQVGDDYIKKSALLGIVIDRVEGENVVLAASVGSPDVLSDEYVPLLITVSRTGGVSISKDTRLDSDMEE